MGALRDVLINRFINSGLKGMEESETSMLAMALLDDTAEDAQLQLLWEKCGGLTAAAQMELSALTSLIGARYAVGVKLIAQLGVYVSQQKKDDTQLITPNQVLDYCYMACECEENERLVVVFLDYSYRVIIRFSYSTYQKGKIELKLSQIVAQAITQKAVHCFVAHNHLNGENLASAEDEEFTRRLYYVLKQLGIDLLEHAIFTANGTYSFYQQGFLSQLQKAYEESLN